MLLHEVPPARLDEWRREPIHAVLVQLGQAALEQDRLRTPEFKKLIASLLELADGRDRREPWVMRTGAARPVPKLRIAIERCFDRYADLVWFRLNKTSNASRRPLLGLFPRMAASLARVKPDDFGDAVEALIAPSPDAALMRLLHPRKGKIRGLGPELFSRLAYAFRRDRFFHLPRPWAQSSGCTKYVGTDLRRYCELCRSLRPVCDELGIPEAVRGTVLRHALEAEEIDPALRSSLDEAVGSDLARFRVLGPADAWETPEGEDAEATGLPLEFASRTIRSRRGQRRLRSDLCRMYGNRCALTGTGPQDLLEVAYIAPFPSGDLHHAANALLLRSDLHTLWDLDLISIDPRSMRVRVSDRLKAAFHRTRPTPPREPAAPDHRRADVSPDQTGTVAPTRTESTEKLPTGDD
ncbi:MAG: HNH endonuclease signature motif containing protein [Planctomycetota bacterium]|jgi:hypothetical protein